MEGITNKEIDLFLDKKVNFFQGVFSSNNIPAAVSNSKYFSLICNLSREGEIGTHFVTVVGFPNVVIYLDTFGVSCVNKEIKKFLSLLNRPILYNNRQIQSYYSNLCGFYCILYVLYFDRIFEDKKVSKIDFVSQNLMNNDDVCIKEIKKLVSLY
jgi:hypothetical protein